MANEIRAGDTVLHLPSGGTWYVVRVNGNDLYPAGWPRTIARTSDCVKIETTHDSSTSGAARMPDKSAADNY